MREDCASRMNPVSNRTDGRRATVNDRRDAVRAGGAFASASWSLAAALLVASPAQAAGDLVLIPDPRLLVALLVLFGLLIVPVNLLVFKPIFRILDEREARTTGTRKRAEKLERDAQEILDRYQAALQAVREESEVARRSALEHARGESQTETARARADSERETEGARSRVAAEFEAARNALRAQSKDLARQAASRVLGRVL